VKSFSSPQTALFYRDNIADPGESGGNCSEVDEQMLRSGTGLFPNRNEPESPIPVHCRGIRIHNQVPQPNLSRDSETMSGERRILVSPRLERVAPVESLPFVEVRWTKSELEDFAGVTSAPPAAPTRDLIALMKQGQHRLE
jgi:hypothetical protein